MGPGVSPHRCWAPIHPVQVQTESKVAATIAEDGIVKVASGAKADTYIIDLPATATSPSILALRLETLVDETLPGKGAGHGNGNFVITKLKADVVPPAGSSLMGRYVRVELPGDKFLSLAEVQVFDGADNLAPTGEAKQVSTDFGGDARRAIDGNTDGQYFTANSTTHTAAGKDPWWELDLKSVKKFDRIAVWNRTDSAGDRLANFRVIVLNDQHEPIWRTDVAASPTPSAELRVDGPRSFEFAAALADYSQAGFESGNLLQTKDPKTKGWAVGGEVDKPHSLILIAKTGNEVPAGSTLRLTMEQKSDSANHTLAQFKLSTTLDPHVEQWARTPSAVVVALQLPTADRSPAQQEAVTRHFLAITPELEQPRQQFAVLQKSVNDQMPDTVPVMKELKDNRRTTKLQFRGNFEDLGHEVTEGTPAIFPPLPEGIPRPVGTGQVVGRCE